MRRTAKYVQACHTARTELGLIVTGVSHDEIYQTLEEASFAWSAKRGKWELQARPVTSSMFGAADESSGVYRLRLMTHPKQIHSFIDDTVRALVDAGYAVDEVSVEYPNRRGVGSRVYITLNKAAR